MGITGMTLMSLVGEKDQQQSGSPEVMDDTTTPAAAVTELGNVEGGLEPNHLKNVTSAWMPSAPFYRAMLGLPDMFRRDSPSSVILCEQATVLGEARRKSDCFFYIPIFKEHHHVHFAEEHKDVFRNDNRIVVQPAGDGKLSLHLGFLKLGYHYKLENTIPFSTCQVSGLVVPKMEEYAVRTRTSIYIGQGLLVVHLPCGFSWVPFECTCCPHTEAEKAAIDCENSPAPLLGRMATIETGTSGRSVGGMHVNSITVHAFILLCKAVKFILKVVL